MQNGTGPVRPSPTARPARTRSLKTDSSILIRRLRRYAWLVAFSWTLAVLSSFLWNLGQENANFRQAALSVALAYLNKNEALRLWATSHERIYLPAEKHAPNPRLADVPERDLTTPSGMRLTLISHVQMTEEINRDYARLFGATAHLTSLRYKGPQGVPDAWEKAALDAFERGETLRTEFTEIDGRPVLRVMQPVIMRQSCLPCHGGDGYEVGHPRGGVSLELPLGKRLARRNRLLLTVAATHGLLWIFGVLLIRMGGRKLAEGILERDRFEKALIKSEDRFRRISEAITDYTFSVTVRDGRVERVEHSPACVAVTGYTSAEFAATPSLWMDIVHPDDREAVREYAERLVRGLRTKPIEYRIRHKDGAFRTVINHPLLHFDAEGTLLAYEGLVRDVTEQKEMERRLFQSQKMQSIATLAGGVAHDFNNMMTGVLGFAELLRARFYEDPKAARMLEQISTSARRAGDLAQQLLAYARGGKYHPKPLCLNHEVRETLDLQRHAFPPGIELVIDLEDGLWSTRADPTQMQQIIMNLCLNAAEAMGSRGRLEVQTENAVVEADRAETPEETKPGRYVLLRVRDSGPGIPPEEIDRIFDPFYSTKAQGRGLGLSAVYGIVKNHGGSVRVRSEPGSGSTFEVLLPALTEPECREESRVPGALDGSETVLLVDDDASVREVVTAFLKERGYTVLSAPDGPAALERLRTHTGGIDLALLDMGLPGMSGAELFRRIDEERPGMKFVIISGYDPDLEIRELLGRSAGEFLQKPFQPVELLAAVRRVLGSG